MPPGQPRTRDRSANSSLVSVRGASVLQELLTELAFVLLPRGMTPKRFGELARSAFVQAAADMSKLRNGKVNHSRVAAQTGLRDRKSTRLNSSHSQISYAVFCLKKKKKKKIKINI